MTAKVDQMMLNEEQSLLAETARRFATQILAPRALEVEGAGDDFPLDLLPSMAQIGLLGLDIPQQYGGQGFDTLTTAVVLEEISAGWFAASSFCAALGAAPILYRGTEEQRARFLPDLAMGRSVLAFALTEPEAGVDAGALRTRATKVDGGYVLDGEKTYTTNAHIASNAVVFARTGSQEDRSRGITCFVVDTSDPGFQVAARIPTLGHRASPPFSIRLDGCFVSDDRRIGEENEGFSYVRTGFAKTRALYAARAVGLGRAAYEHARRYLADRTTFGLPLLQRDIVLHRLGEYRTRLEAARRLTYWACVAQDVGDDPASEETARMAANMAKAYSAEIVQEVTAGCMQLMGGAGYSAHHPMERWFREARLFSIGDGASEILNLQVGRWAG